MDECACVLDASAVLAVLVDEPGSEIVSEYMAKGVCAMSTVNYSEILSVCRMRGGSVGEMVDVLHRLPLALHSFDEVSAVMSVELVMIGRQLGLSMGDRACLSLAKRLSAPVLTADRIWRKVGAGYNIVLIR